ncbi:MAG: alpha/beta fold hydrolase [Saccharospirillum sp.]
MYSWTLTETYDFQGRSVRFGCLGDGPPVVLVHGTPWSSFTLRHLIWGLAKTHTVYYYDLLGYGQSDKAAGDVSLGIQNQVLDRLLNHWALDAPVAIGHDFGGATVLRAHLLNGRRFRQLILVNPVAISPWGSPFFRHVQAHEDAFSGLPDALHEALVRAYVKTALFQPLQEGTLDAIVRPWLGGQGKAAFYRQMAQADARFTDEVQALYHRISSPALILWGREDTWIPWARGAELQRLIPDARLRVIDGAGHLIIEEKPETLLQEITAFVAA